ncbi:PKD domain-containing protein [Pedobacter sp. WC2501]|uniref:PKD domain-containing protein n=1 Tax=Pedobacter sp. WC2501 TaxID=3461400 RepID=UPI004046577B
MRYLLILFLLATLNLSAFGKFTPPINDELINAINITNTSAYCSGDAEFNNLEATTSNYNKALNWPAVGKDVWYKFTASKFDVNISVSGKIDANSTNTLINPLIALYSFDPATNSIAEHPGSQATSNNVISLYKGALTVGQVYYVRVSAANDATGTFKLCIDNYFPPIQPGQDCGTFSVLCTKETFTQLNVTGSGANNHESAGTCLGTESNSAWYMFKASKPGDFTFVITPTVTTNDIDWVFYDLGLNGDCSKISAANAIRCASGSGVTCSPSYYKTGLSMTETDLNEALGCPAGQNGFVKYVELQQDHVYAILIDNFSGGNNGFTLEFGGTADFAGPTAEIDVKKLNACTDNQAYTFESKASNFASLKWSFGEGASLASATTAGPFTITYNTPGEKIVVLEAKGTNGCNVVTTQTFIVANTPEKPIISASKVNLCQGDVLKLSTPFLNLASYHWSGPNGFVSTNQSPEIQASGPEIVGTYKLYVQVGDCVSELNSVDILSVDLKPEALFSIEVNHKCESDQSFSFINASKNYTKLSWDFGPGVESEVAINNDSKILTFTKAGLKTITLKVESDNGCVSTFTKDVLVELKPEKPEISINQPFFCLKDIIKLAVPAQEGITYAWSGPNNYSATTNAIEIPVTDFNLAGQYQVVLTSGSCNSEPATIIVPAIARIPVAKFYTEPTFDVKFSAPVPITFTNTSLYGDFYEWGFGDGLTSSEQNPTHIYQTDGLFRITLTAFSKNGCSNSITQGDLIIKKNASTFVPNAFSPNGDGINDELVVSVTNLKKYNIHIYNRLGTQIFFTNNIFENWNGTFKGNELPVGVYYYIISGTNLSNNNVKYSGSITLIR